MWSNHLKHDRREIELDKHFGRQRGRTCTRILRRADVRAFIKRHTECSSQRVRRQVLKTVQVFVNSGMREYSEFAHTRGYVPRRERMNGGPTAAWMDLSATTENESKQA